MAVLKASRSNLIRSAGTSGGAAIERPMVEGDDDLGMAVLYTVPWYARALEIGRASCRERVLTDV